MAVAKKLTDPMLDPYRKMAKECIEKGCAGESCNTLIALLQRMEDLALEEGDFTSFSARLMEENLQSKFNQYYGEAVAEAARTGSGLKDNAGDDDMLLAMTIEAYEDHLLQLKSTQARTLADADSALDRLNRADRLIPVIEKIITMGKSGISYPKFLTQLITFGLDRAHEGRMASKDTIHFDIEVSKETSIPPVVKMHEERLLAFAEMTNKNPFGTPDAFEYSLKSEEIEWKYAPVIDKWLAIQTRVEKMFTLLIDWLDSYCIFAADDDRWAVLGNPGATGRNIRRTMGCNPGFLKERERIFNENFSLTWDDIFGHTVFKFWHGRLYFPWSEERFELMKETYQYCIPRGKPVIVDPPPRQLITRAEKLHNENRCINPKLGKHEERVIELYDRYWGEGSYKNTFGM